MAEMYQDQQQQYNDSGADIGEAYHYEQERLFGASKLSTTTRSNNMNTNADINSMSFDQLVPTNSKYLKQGDVGEDGVILTVRGFKQEEMETDDGMSEQKIVMYFMEEGYKPMVLNKTNATLLANATGAKVAGDARGKQIIVYADPSIGFGGKVTGGLRIRRYSQAAPAQPKAATHAPASDPFDEHVPF